MDETTMNKFYKLYLDMLQDSRADAKIEERYSILIDILFDNATLNWDKSGLRFSNDEFINAILKSFEPRKYQYILDKLQNKEKNEEE